MAQDYSPSLVTKNLVFCADAAMKSAAGPATLLYDKVNDNNGTMYNGTCLDFDGTNDYVTVPHNSILDNENALTIECWINTSFDATFPGEIGVVRKGSGSASGWSNAGWSIRLRDDIPAIAFRKKDDTGYWDLYTGDKIIDGNWHHIVGTFDTTTLRKYVDGVETQSTSTGQAYLTTTENLEIGRISAYLDGSISNVKLYNVALSAANVKELYDDSKVIIPTKNDASGGFVAQTNLKGWWPLTEGVGTIAYDGSGNGNDGTLTNMDPATDWLTGQTGCPQLVEGYNRPFLFDADGYADFGVDDGGIPKLTLDAVTDYTFSWWSRHTSQNNPNLFTSGGSSIGGFNLNWAGSTNRPILYLAGNNYAYFSDNAAQDDGQWHHWLLTYNGTATSGREAIDSKLYIDGVNQSITSATYTAAPTTWGAFRIGRATSAGTFAGNLNEFIIYNGQLGSSDRAALYVRGPNGGPLPPDPMSLSNSSDILAYWRNDGKTTWKNRGPQTIKNFTSVATDPINDSNSVGSWTHNGTSLTSVPGGRWGASGTPNGGRPPRYRLLFDSGTNHTVNSIIAVTEGKTYKVSAWYMAGTVSSAMLRVAGPGLSTPVSIGAFTTYTTHWINKTSTFTATATANVTIELHNRATGTQFFDDVTLVESGPALDGTVGGSPDALLFKQGVNDSGRTSTGRDNQGFPLLGKNNGAVGFNGSDNYIVIDGVASLMGSVTDFTISCWAKCVDNGANQILVAVNSAGLGTVTLMRVSCDNDNKYFDVYDGNGVDITGTTNVADGNWHYFTYVRAGTGTDEAHIYVDGVLQNSGTHTSGLSSDDLWSIGQEWDAGPAASQFFNGQIANVQIYNRALSQAEITQNLNAQRSRFT